MLPHLASASLVDSLLFPMLQLGLSVAVLIAGIIHWQALRAWFRPGLQLGAAVFLLSLPGLVAAMLYLEIAGPDLPPDSPLSGELFLTLVRVGAAVTAVGTLVLGVFITALQVGLGELAVVGGGSAGMGAAPSAYPWLLGGRQDRRGWPQGAVLGLAGGLVSVLVFWAVGVGDGPDLEWMKRLAPKLMELGTSTGLLVAVPAVLLAAVTEEVLFRGLVQGWLTRWLGNTRQAALLAILLSSAAWAIAHWGSTDQPWLKLGQVFLFGLGLGVLARRYSVESSIVAHGVFNLVAVAAGLAHGS
jgi:membrane protease YdiL (CAAX protease family)